MPGARRAIGAEIMIECAENGTRIRCRPRDLDELPFGIEQILEKGDLSKLPANFQSSFVYALGHGSQPMFGLPVPSKTSRFPDKHLRDQYPFVPILYELASSEDLKNFVRPPEWEGTLRRKPQRTVEYLHRQGDPYLQGDYNNKQSKGVYDLAITTLQRDVIWINNCFCLRGPPYYWSSQYLAELDAENFHALVSDAPMPNHAPLKPAPGQDYPKVQQWVLYDPRASQELRAFTGAPKGIGSATDINCHGSRVGLQAMLRLNGASDSVVATLVKKFDSDSEEEPADDEEPASEDAMSLQQTQVRDKRRREASDVEGGGSDIRRLLLFERFESHGSEVQNRRSSRTKVAPLRFGARASTEPSLPQVHSCFASPAQNGHHLKLTNC